MTTDLQKLVRAAAKERREYMQRYWRKNRKHLRLYRTKWTATQRAVSVPFAIYGYLHPTTKKIEFTRVDFGVKRK